MNIPATLAPGDQVNDLVLRFVGGTNDGESISISTECCALGVTRRLANNTFARDQCAIYRGPAGVAVKSHGDELLINGEAKSVHWLERGDKIQVSDSQSVEVVHLGAVATESETPEVAVIETADVASDASESVFVDSTPQVDSVMDLPVTESAAEPAELDVATEAVTETVDVAGDRIDFVSRAVQDQLAYESSSFSQSSLVSDPAFSQGMDAPMADSVPEASIESEAQEPPVAPVGDAGQVDEGEIQRLDSLESSVNQLHDQATNVDRRFDRLEDSLNALTEHLERLTAGSLSSASVEPTPDTSLPAPSAAFPSASFITQAAQEVADPSFANAPAETAASDIVEAPAVLQTPEATADAVHDQPSVSAGDSYEKSIATLFSELASTDSPEAADAQVAIQSAAEPSPSETVTPIEEQASLLNSLEIPPAITPTPAEPTGAGFASELEVGFTEQMHASMNDESPTLSSEEIADVVGLGVANPEAPVPEAPVEEPLAVEAPPAVQSTTPEVAEAVPALREEVRTESVAEIFARLQSSPATQGVDDPTSPAAPIRQTVQTTFEDIQASISAALDADVTAVPEVDPGNGEANQVDATEPVAMEAVASVEPAQPADDVDSVMERLRANLAAEEDSETTEESDQIDATGTQQATDVPVVARKQQDSVEDYMSMLMARMNDESDGPDEDASPIEAPSEVSDFNRPQNGVLEEAAIETLLTEEEFVPKQKAMPIKSLDKMRELANSTSRSAVQRSETAMKIERKKSLVLQALALGSLALAVLMIWGKSYIAGGAFAMIFFVTSAFFLYDTVSPSRSTAIAQVKKTKDSRPESEPTPETDGN